MQIVRNRRIPGRERPSRMFEGLYDFANLFNLFLVSTIALLVVYIIILVITSLVSPSFVKKLDEKMTDNLVEHLVSHQDYETAISLMEINPDYVQKKGYSNDLRLGECYEKTGAYSSALKYYLENFRILHSEEIRASVDSSTFKAIEYLMARYICRVYIDMGDKIRAEEYLHVMEAAYSDSTMVIASDVAEQAASTLGVPPVGDISWISVAPAYYKAILNYTDNPIESIQILKDVISSEADEERLSANIKLEHLNTLIGWEIENGMDVAALYDILVAISQSEKAYYNRDFKEFGRLASYCKWAGDEEHYNKLMAAYRRYLSSNHKKNSPEAILAVKYLVDIGHFYQAENMLDRICSNIREKIRGNISIMSDDQREFYLRTLEEPFAYSEELLTGHPSPRLARIVAENTLFKKGLLLRSNRNQRLSILSQNDPQLVAQYEDLISARKELNIIKSIDRPDQIIRRAILQNKIYNLDKELAAACSSYVGDNLLGEMSVKTLQESLGKQDLFVYLSSNRSGQLFALRLSRKKDVQYIGIGSLANFETSDFNTPEKLYTSTEFSEKLLSSLSFSKKGKGINYCSTSGIYNKISLQALRVSESAYLMDIADIRFISDPFLIAKHKETETLSGRVSLWGGVRYSQESSDSTTTAFFTHRSVKRGDHLVYLPGSLSEVEGIYQTLSRHRITSDIYSGWDATEDSFKDRDGMGDRILHISTHGFFNDSSPVQGSSEAMDNSGLLFAGAEKSWALDSKKDTTIQETENDGILRASEIELMNLNGCSLVVLSACETGLGFEDNSEGVYGLQRAFRLAGVENVLMTLWEIPDKETSLLMQSFYQSLIEGADVNTALETAQKKVREKFPSPESWGGFVLLN